ncbi:hypothetical protein ACFVS2_05375 [Brevibacillus sp. NPDC058079]|uniref:hypothetical protein n=1 Tax=Brevibacillus sp. NPDC058079 TaxID=3346330 RepID=UPI0036E9C2F4
MTKTEVDKCLQYYTEKYEITYEKNPLCYHTKGAIQSCFQFEYDSDGKVNFIQISSALKEVLNCVFDNLDVFNTNAEELVEKIDKISNYDRNLRELGWTYNYQGLGLSFWRPNILKESDMQEDWFKELESSIQEDEKRNLYLNV